MLDFTSPKQGRSGFGFANLMSATRTLLKESAAGYERLAERTESTDSPAPLVDMSGIADEDRVAIVNKIGGNVQARREIVRKYAPVRRLR